MRGANKDLKSLAREYRQMGWRIEHTNANHFRWLGPYGEHVITSRSPGDWHAIVKIKADLRKAARAVLDS
jgi:hypothetical protein